MPRYKIQGPPIEENNCLACREISGSFVTIFIAVSQINPVDTIAARFFKLSFNNILKLRL